MFEVDLQIDWKSPDDLQLLQSTEANHPLLPPPKRRQGRKRLTESLLGLRWVRAKDLPGTAAHLHSFNADDVYGTLHFCAPSIVFAGSMFAPQILKLINEHANVVDVS